MWSKAKNIAKKQNPDDFYALANHIFQNMKNSKKASLWHSLVRLANDHPGKVQDALLPLLQKHTLRRYADGQLWGAYGLFTNGKIVLRVTHDQYSAEKEMQLLHQKGAERSGVTRKPLQKEPRAALHDLITTFGEDGATRGVVEYA